MQSLRLPNLQGNIAAVINNGMWSGKSVEVKFEQNEFPKNILRPKG
jgi:hypothetical protein